jgi:hypothetical protein
VLGCCSDRDEHPPTQLGGDSPSEHDLGELPAGLAPLVDFQAGDQQRSKPGDA